MEVKLKRVLIVDDTKFMRDILKNILKKKELEVVGEASNGKEAVLKYQELRPDLVTMDIIMPEMDGIEAVKRIMQIDPSARILMCSAMGQQALVIEAIQSGARDFVIKPFQPARVLEAVDRALSGE
ncbi:MAG: response regulator [Candidatus Goldbacteria bacterium]|nr:response regulator [Candidatus Goldiibacteriota bacterium]